MEAKIKNIDGAIMTNSIIEAHFAFAGIHNELQKNGGDVSKLNITISDRAINSDEELRSMLSQLLSFDWDVDQLSIEEKSSLNVIRKYLKL